MSLDAVDYQGTQSDVRTAEDNRRNTLLTPARRAALDALEHEFRELLNAPQRQRA
jgi:hypothetical protein